MITATLYADDKFALVVLVFAIIVALYWLAEHITPPNMW